MKNETMGAMIATKRKELGMTQLDLAEKMGVTDKAVSKWERDLSYPDINSLPKLAEVFGMTVDELMQVKQDSIKKEETSSGNLISLIFRAICMAMGIAVVVLSIMNQIETRTAIMLLGIGLTCGGISLFEKSEKYSK